jgi:arylsulfatase A-like enzyme
MSKDRASPLGRREFVLRAAGAALAAVPFATAACRRRAARRSAGPNLIYIMADDLGFADLSIYGRSDYQTPVLDELAREGVRLTQAYSAAPVCSPTRVALMTGRYPARLEAGLHEPLTTHPTGLSPDVPTLPRLLKEAGYETALVGKWHLGLAPAFHPLRHGFDEFFGHLGAAVDYASHIGTEHRRYDLFDGWRPARVDGYATDLFTARAIDFISRSRGGPFFLSLQYNAPHWPWQAPGDPATADSLYSNRGGTAETFAQMVRSMDNGVGRLLQALRDHGIERETLVIFTSDNGGEKFSDMGPFQRGKMTLWEGGIRVAAMARWPGVIPAGTSTDQVAITMDWMATLLAAADVVADPAQPLDGMDVMPQLTGSSPLVPRELYWRTFQRTRHKALRSGNWKYLVTEDGAYLFDLPVDPGEAHDRKRDAPDVFARLETAYAAWEDEVLEPIPLDPRFA